MRVTICFSSEKSKESIELELRFLSKDSKISLRTTVSLGKHSTLVWMGFMIAWEAVQNDFQKELIVIVRVLGVIAIRTSTDWIAFAVTVVVIAGVDIVSRLVVAWVEEHRNFQLFGLGNSKRMMIGRIAFNVFCLIFSMSGCCFCSGKNSNFLRCCCCHSH